MRILKELDDFLQFFAGFIDAGDIVKRHLAMLFGQQLGLGFSKTHRARTAALLHLAQHEKSNAKNEQEGQGLIEQDQPEAGLFFGLALHIDAIFIEQLVKIGVAGNGHGDDLFAIGQFTSDAVG